MILEHSQQSPTCTRIIYSHNPFVSISRSQHKARTSAILIKLDHVYRTMIYTDKTNDWQSPRLSTAMHSLYQIFDRPWDIYLPLYRRDKSHLVPSMFLTNFIEHLINAFIITSYGWRLTRSKWSNPQVENHDELRSKDYTL